MHMSDTTHACTAHFYNTPASLQDSNGNAHWIARAANFVVVATRVHAGCTVERAAAGQDDEYMLILPEDMPARIEAAEASVDSTGDSLTIVPPGASRITPSTDGWIYRIFSSQAHDLAQRAGNAAAYEQGAPGVTPLETWPMPVGGYRLRHYRLADHVRTDTTMRLFRTRHLMVNVFLPNKAPRDIRKMTPHSHPDFEQGSLAIRGSYVHHLRYPWTADMTSWREDEHGEVASPSLIVIPPKVIHTSQSIGVSGMRLVDIFAPPRDDFSLKPGLVCNAADYPLPERLVGMPAPANAA